MNSELDRIGFLLHHPELFNHYRNVWKHLPSNAFEIAVTSGTKKVYDAIVESCRRYELPWRDAAELLCDKRRYTTLVSSFPSATLGADSSPALTKSLGRFSLRFMYGNGKAGWNFRPWNTLYDSILCFGPYQVENLAFCTNTLKVQMGYPRFDSFFNEPLDRTQRLRELGLDPARKTVVWLPTWSSLSSIEPFAPALVRLQASYNVIVKPHPFTVTDEPARMQALEPFDCVIREPIDNVPLFQLADFVVCDYGGSAFGAIYTDRNAVLLDLPNAASDPMTGQSSSDIAIRKQLPHVSVAQAEQLDVLLDDPTQTLWPAQQAVRFALREYHFAPFYGYSGQVAALAIANAPLALTRRP